MFIIYGCTLHWFQGLATLFHYFPTATLSSKIHNKITICQKTTIFIALAFSYVCLQVEIFLIIFFIIHPTVARARQTLLPLTIEVSGN